MSDFSKNQHPPRLLERFLFVCLLLGTVVGFGFFEGLFSSAPSMAISSMALPCAKLIHSEQTATNHPTLTTTDKATPITSLHTGAPPPIHTYDSPTQSTPTSPTPLIIAGFLLTATIKPRRKTAPTTPQLHLRQRQETTTASNTTYHYGDLRSPPHAKRHFSAKNRISYWPSRDPTEEDGGVNLYGFVYNDSINWLDGLGHSPIGDGISIVKTIIKGKHGGFKEGANTGSSGIFGKGITEATEENGERVKEKAKDLRDDYDDAIDDILNPPVAPPTSRTMKCVYHCTLQSNENGQCKYGACLFERSYHDKDGVTCPDSIPNEFTGSSYEDEDGCPTCHDEYPFEIEI